MNYRSYVGPEDRYDLMSAIQFNILTHIGLREHHKLLDVGCGSLRAGKLFIPYLGVGNYHGIDPNRWLIEDGVQWEVGQSQVMLKNPRFLYRDDWRFSVFEETFDYLIAQSIFTHTTTKQVADCMREAEQVMHRDSVFIANFQEGTEDYAGEVWAYPHVVAFTMNHMIELAEHAGLVVYEFDWWHPGGHRWFAMAKEGCELIGKYPQFSPAYRVERTRSATINLL